MRAATCCTVGDCDRPHNARGMCKAHYVRWQTHGDDMDLDPINPHIHLDPAPILARINGHTDAAFARAVGISTSTMTRWRNGTRGLSLNMAERVADHLGIHPAVLWPKEW